MNLFRKKGLGQVHPGLNRHLRLWDLIILGIGAMVGTGIFTITGTAAANLACLLYTSHIESQMDRRRNPNKIN